ncbi:hypothetical protein, partial [Mesorhizobium ciceri]|uniref:hypothetical protein n=1 Tax=Mesorhizobium ciceri TaxID=39645 RepID=UPI00344F7F31
MISTKSYLERHSLLAAVGLATRDTPDDDGRTGARSDAVQAVLDKWLTKAKEAKSAAELERVWKDGIKEIRATKD